MSAAESLAEIVGRENVLDSSQVLDEYKRDQSFVNPVRPASVVKPETPEQVEKIIRLANENNTPLVPVSSGPPHFRGDTVPSTGGAIIVDLSNMNKIMFVDRERRVAMCEPGVTFSQLLPEVRAAGLRLNMPLLPRATKSVIGSILEREPVTMPAYQWDISDPLACAGLYFGTGDEFRTGQAAGPGTVAEQWSVGGKQKAPYGPGTASLHRMIQGAQGTMGIVTWVSMRCEILPSQEEPFVVNSTTPDQLLELAYWLIRQRMVNECFILNNTNLAAMFAGDVNFRNARAALPPWTLFYTVAGYEYFPEQRVASHVEDITRITQRLGLEAVKSAGNISANIILAKSQRPSDEPYWKLRPRGSCEDIFYLTQREKVSDQIEAMTTLVEKSGYNAGEMGIYIQPAVQGTSHHCEFNLFYDPADNTECSLVRNLTSKATSELNNRGAFFSRPYGENSVTILNRDAASVNVLHTFKKIFDPNNVMNPGKVCF